MATELKKVERGDLIESDLINLIIDWLMELHAKISGMGGTGAASVPNLFGKTLSTAQSMLSEPPISLKLGNTIDAYGALLNPGLAETKQKIVIGQAPPAGARVATNSLVDVLLSVQAGGTGTTPTPVATKITGFNPAKTPVGEKVTIFGENFEVDFTKTKVFFADVPTATPESGATGEVLVRVPATITVPAGTEKRVSVRVETSFGKATADTTLLPPLEGPPPEFKSIKGVTDPDALVVGEIATIEGKNFSSKIQENSVKFGDTTTPVETAGNTTSTLKVKVPELPGLTSGNHRTVDIVVIVATRQSNIVRKEVNKF